MAASTGASTAAQAGKTERPVRIWDLPTRLFHWTLVVCVTGSVVSAKLGGNAMVWHFRFGYAIFALLAFRLAWGLVGGHWSRFASFFVTPARLLAYLRGGGGDGAGADVGVGHNPLGALSVFAMLALLAVQVGSGLFADDEIANSGPLVALVSGATSSSLTSWHKSWGQWLILGLIGLHITAVLVYLWRMRQNLIRPMITGDKILSEPVRASADGWRQRLLALLLIGLGAGLVAAVVQLGSTGFGG
ncbi:cytochrome b/b6 domain-containing protein [Piscinibacter sakaiensis]|uniref:cytochrome b/b6 domain-containing protein n=1 Tax=Piscinibacter sakaiensis TaxID=1547922 RepID=UPI003AAE0C44